MNQIIIQGVGYVALLFSILSFQKNKRSSILLYLIIANILFSLHFSLLHAWTGAAMSVLRCSEDHPLLSKGHQGLGTTSHMDVQSLWGFYCCRIDYLDELC